MSIAGSNNTRKEAGNTQLRESCRVLLSHLISSASGLRVVGVTACRSGQGASTVAANLAIEAVSAGQSVLLVDANLQRPALHTAFGLQPGRGFAELLCGEVEIAELLQSGGMQGLGVLPAGTPLPEGSLIESGALEAVLSQVKQAGFDLVVFDLPTSASGLMTARLGSLLDGVVLVVTAGSNSPDQVRRERDLLTQAGVRLLGVVLNRYRSDVPEWLRQLIGG